MKSLLRKLLRGKRRKAQMRHRLQDIQTRPGLNLVKLGSEYGGWVFHDDGDLQGATIISAGLGEDASFDVEFATRYNARVILVDPTPRAIAHFERLKARFGRARDRDHVGGGVQPADSYDLSHITESHLLLEPVALWTEETTLRFFTPADPAHVSHSVVNFQNDYRTDTAHIEVPSCRLDTLLKRHGLAADGLALLKLDIEGAEIEVLEDMMKRGLRPRQICVEFDELNRPGQTAFDRVDRADTALQRAGYSCVYGNGQTDYLYLRVHEGVA